MFHDLYQFLQSPCDDFWRSAGYEPEVVLMQSKLFVEGRLEIVVQPSEPLHFQSAATFRVFQVEPGKQRHDCRQ